MSAALDMHLTAHYACTMPRINGPKRHPIALRIHPRLGGEVQAIVSAGEATLTELVEEGLRMALDKRKRAQRRNDDAPSPTPSSRANGME